MTDAFGVATGTERRWVLGVVAPKIVHCLLKLPLTGRLCAVDQRDHAGRVVVDWLNVGWCHDGAAADLAEAVAPVVAAHVMVAAFRHLWLLWWVVVVISHLLSSLSGFLVRQKKSRAVLPMNFQSS